MSVVSDVEIRLRADIARLRQDMQDARREVTGALNNMSAAAEAFKGVLGGIAAGLSVGAFAAFIKQSIDAADALNDMSVRTKVAIEDLAGLAYAAKLGDTSLDGVASSISKLGQNIGKEGAKFRALGITATEPLEAFKQLADVFKNIQDPQQRAAFGAEALGKSWQEAAVLLEGGSEGIASLIARGQELSGITEQVAADAGAFNDKLDELTFAAQGAGTRIAAGLLPTLQKIADSFSANSVNGDAMTNTVTVLSAALKGLYSVGVGISALFVGLAKSIGGTAAVAVAALSGDFKGALDIYKTMAADVYTGLGDAAIQIAKVWVDTGKSVTKEATDAGDAIADSLIAAALAGNTAASTAAKVSAFLGQGDAARQKSADLQDKIGAEAAKWAAKTLEDANKHIAVLTAELAATVPLTAEQKKTIEVMVEMEKRRANLSDEQRKNITDTRAEVEMLERLTAARVADKKAQEDAEDAAKRDTDAAWDKVRSLQEQVRTYGLTEEAIGRLQVAEYQRQLGAAELSDVEQRRIMGLLTATEEQIKLQEKLGKMKAETTFWDGLESTAHQTFLSIANGGKDVATRLKETFKNVFFDWLYQQTIKKWVINIGTETTTGSTASSIASLFSGGSSSGSGAGGILGTASNWLSIGKTIYSGFTSGISASLGSTISSMGATFGNSAVSAFGAGMQGGEAAFSAAAAGGNSAAIGAGSSAASAIPIIGWIIAGMQAADGFRKQGFTANNGTINNPILQAGALPTNFAEKTMKAIGFNDAIANILSGAAINTKLFGRADPRVEAQGLRGTVSAAGFDADSYAKIIEKGGIFRRSKRYEKTADLDAATDKTWDETITNMITSVKGFGSAMGLQANAIDGYSKSFDIKLTGKAEEDNAAVAKLFGEVGDELSLRLVPGLAAFAKEGETMSATLQRLAVDYQTVDAILTATGQSIKLFGVAGIQAREDLIAAAGGLEQLSAGVNYFQQNFLTGAQQLAPVQKQVADALAALGMSAVKTNEQFAAATLGIDLSTKAGADLYVKMLALAPAFKTVADAAKAQADAAKAQADAALAAAQESARAAEQLAAAKAAEELQRIADAARALSGAVDSALSGLERAVQSQRDANQKTFADLMKSIGASIETVTGKIAGIKAVADQLRTGVATDNGAGAMASARAALAAAAAEAKNSGLLPDPEALRTILETVRRDSTDQFGTMIEYQRAAAAANRDIEALAGAADTELSVAQKTLLTLQDQRAAAQLAYDTENMRLDGILAQGQATVDKLNGIYGGVLAIPDAIAALAATIKAAMANPVSAAGGAAQSAYQTYLGRAGTESEIAFWKEQATRGVDVAGAIAGSEEAQIQALYQKYLGRTGEAAGVDLWEAARASGQTWQQIEAGFAGSAEAQGRTSPQAMQVALETLNTQMASMQMAMNRTAMSTTKLADQFDQVSGGGNALYTEPA